MPTLKPWLKPKNLIILSIAVVLLVGGIKQVVEDNTSNQPAQASGSSIIDLIFDFFGTTVGLGILAGFLALVAFGFRAHAKTNGNGAKHAVSILGAIVFVLVLGSIALVAIFQDQTGEVIDTYRAQLAEKIDPRPGAGAQNQTPQNAQNNSSGTGSAGGAGGGTQNLNSAPTNTPDRIDKTLAWLEETAEEISIRDIVRSWWIWLFVPIVYFWSWIRYNRAQSRLSMKGDFDWFGNLMRALGPAGLVAVLVMGLKAVTIWA